MVVLLCVSRGMTLTQFDEVIMWLYEHNASLESPGVLGTQPNGEYHYTARVYLEPKMAMLFRLTWG